VELNANKFNWVRMEDLRSLLDQMENRRRKSRVRKMNGI